MNKVLATESQQGVGLVILGASLFAALWDILQQFLVASTASELSFGRPIAWISFVYLATLTAGWTSSLGFGTSRPLLVLIRMGSASSVVYLLTMLTLSFVSPASFIAHGCNVLFWFAAERSPRGVINFSRMSVTMCSTFALTLAALYVASTEHARLQREQTEREQFVSSLKPYPETRRKKALTNTEPAENSDSSTRSSLASNPTNSAISVKPHQIGAANAKACFVVYFDYKNERCRQIGRDLHELLIRYPDSVSIVARHYPASANGNAPLESSARPDACRVNLISETAGLLKGEEGFWQMHQWLLNCQEPNLVEETRNAIATLGIESDEFDAAMLLPSGLARIFSDIVEARSKGIQGAPAVLLNGHRLNELDASSLELAVQATIGTTKSIGDQESLAAKAVDSAALGSFPSEQQIGAALATVRIVNPAANIVGSGFIFAKRGTFVYVLSAWHLTTNTKNVEVQTFSSESYPKPAQIHSQAAVIAASEAADLAVIRFSTREAVASPLRFIPLALVSGSGDFESLTTGCDGLESPPTCIANRVIAARKLKRNSSASPAMMWEVKNPSITGRSGGALLDAHGRVLGIASGNSENRGYFCHATEVYSLLSNNGLSGLLNLTESK